jgi:hypothetical protein
MPQHTDAECISYHIDSQGRLSYISDRWSRFARRNKAQHLTPSSVLGRPLLTLISDDSTRHIYALMIERSRRDRVRLDFPFRCDAPDRRRFMRMRIFPLEDGGVGFSSCLIREEPRQPVRLLETDAERSGRLVRICSWCKRIETGASEWLEAEAAVQRLNLFDSTRLPGLTHGMCPTCHAAYLQNLADT